MSLTSIGSQKTPGRPSEITFDADTGLPSDLQEVCLIGKKDVTSGTATVYNVTQIANSGDIVAGTAEANAKFGLGSQIALMVIAAIKANAGRSTYPKLSCIPLASTDADFGAADAALTALQKIKCEFVVSPFDGHSATALRDKLKATALLMSAAQRVHNNQYGTMGVVFNRSVVDPTTLFKFDTQYLIGVWLRDTGVSANAPVCSGPEVAAAAAAMMASNGIPFNPVDDLTIANLAAPLQMSDWITVGAALESESALGQGWTPLRVMPNGDVAFVRSVTGRVTVDGAGVTNVLSYYDVQDFQTLYYFRKTLTSRMGQPDMKRRKASLNAAKEIKGETIRLMQLFQDQEMFQSVSQLAKLVKVERNVSDRSRFDIYVPVNVVPGLHVIASNIVAGTKFDVITV